MSDVVDDLHLRSDRHPDAGEANATLDHLRRENSANWHLHFPLDNPDRTVGAGPTSASVRPHEATILGSLEKRLMRLSQKRSIVFRVKICSGRFFEQVPVGDVPPVVIENFVVEVLDSGFFLLMDNFVGGFALVVFDAVARFEFGVCCLDSLIDPPWSGWASFTRCRYACVISSSSASESISSTSNGDTIWLE